MKDTLEQNYSLRKEYKTPSVQVAKFQEMSVLMISGEDVDGYWKGEWNIEGLF